MAQRSHVPKFGNWESDNVPYTAFFENARKEKASGVRMNPNDPEENPEAFGLAGGEILTDSISHSVQSPLHISSESLMSAEKHNIEGYKKPPSNHRRNTSDQQRGGSRKTSESGSSDRSSSDQSLMQPNHRRTRSDRKKSIIEGRNNFYPPSPGPDRLRGGKNPSVDISGRSASVPKFGAWDERDPKSGEGFTVIFNRVKEEKHTSAAKFPSVPPPQPSNFSHTQKKDNKSKKCCCLF